MDDVGQTLLNWASAFGTQEMVEFLCDRGADVNKGMLFLSRLDFFQDEFISLLWRTKSYLCSF